MSQPKRKSSVSPVDLNVRWMLVAEVAAYLRISPQTVRGLIHRGALKAVNAFGLSGGFRVEKSDVDAFMTRRKRIIPAYRRGSHPWVKDRWAKERRKSR